MTRACSLTLILASLLLPGMCFALEALEDDAMAAVTGQEGVAIELELRLNTDAAGAPLATLTNCGAGGGTFENSECRFALSFQGQTDEWLVFRGVFGYLKIDDISLNAGNLAQGATAPIFDPSKFQDDGGACLVPGGCTAGNIQNLPALAFAYPATATSYSPGAPAGGASSGYNSLQLGYTIRETELLFGADAFLDGTPTDPNAITDSVGSFLGLRIADNNANFAGIAIGGTAYVYGF